MSKATETFKQIVELLDILSEGFEYTSALIVENKLDEALEMLYNIIAGIDSIINNLNPHVDELPGNDLQNLGVVMSDELNKLIDIFKTNNAAVIESHITSNLGPAFLAWKIEIEKLLRPFVLS